MLLSLLRSPDSTSISLWPPTGDDIKTIAAVATLLFGGGMITSAISRWRARQQEKRALKKLPVGDFLPATVKSALRYYVEHEVSAIDPAGRELDRANLGPREPLFRLLDRTFYETHEKQHLLLLADSGMGKTTALLNYYSHNAKRKNSHPIVIFSLKTEGVADKIAAVPNQQDTILLLDALDEDPTAVADHTARVHGLMKSAENFRAVLLSCRSQFFLSTEEITKETGIARLQHRGLGETAEHLLLKFYLCPFSETQVEKFLRKRYPFPQWEARRRARATVSRVRDLTARPMLLAYLDDLTRSGHTITRISDAYREIVEQWIKREKPLVEDSAALLEFSKKLAVELYVNREVRGGEQAPAQEIVGLAAEWNIPLDRWQLTGRSLLTRDAADQFRFAHRSILEYLFARSLIEGDWRCATVEWTDQMQVFLKDMLRWSDYIGAENDHTHQQIKRIVSLSQQAAEGLNTNFLSFILDLVLKEFIVAFLRVQRIFDLRTAAKQVTTLQELVAQRPVRALIQLAFGRTRDGLGYRLGDMPTVHWLPLLNPGLTTVASSGDLSTKVLGSLTELSPEKGAAILEALKNHPWDESGNHIYHHHHKQGYSIAIPFTANPFPYGFLIVIHSPKAPADEARTEQLCDAFREWIMIYKEAAIMPYSMNVLSILERTVVRVATITK